MKGQKLSIETTERPSTWKEFVIFVIIKIGWKIYIFTIWSEIKANSRFKTHPTNKMKISNHHPPPMLQVQSNSKQILWSKFKKTDLCVFHVLRRKRCKPSWTWQAWSTWPQVTDGYKFYRDAHSVNDRERERKTGEGVNLVSSGCCWFWRREREKMRAGLEKEKCSMLLAVAKDYRFAKQAGGQDSQSWKYKEDVAAQDVVALFHLGSVMALENLPVWAKEKREGLGREAEVRVGECVLTKPYERSCYELVVNLSIL